MKTLTFFGASDDCFEIEGSSSGDTDELNGDRVTLEIRQQDKGLVVHGAYVTPGVWALGVGPLDEDVPMPDWPMAWAFDGYTARLTISVPDHAVVKELARD